MSSELKKIVISVDDFIKNYSDIAVCFIPKREWPYYCVWIFFDDSGVVRVSFRHI